MLEVKGGGIELVRGNWFTTNRQGRFPIKDPFDQATASKHALAYLRASGLNMRTVPLGHPVVFPDIAISHQLGPAAPKELIWDGTALRSIHQTVLRTVDHWNLSCKLTTEDLRLWIKPRASGCSLESRSRIDCARRRRGF